MSAPFQYREAERESLHKALFGLHNGIRDKALTQITKALDVCNKLEASSSDARPAAQAYIEELRAIRDQLEGVMRRAAEFRTKTIRDNGCDASCSERA